jgi:hypothetical protein
MKRLLQIELLKLRNYRAFWILIGLYATALVLTLWFSESILNSILDGGPTGFMTLDVDSFPDSWHYLTYLAGFFTYILMVIVVLLVSSEFTYKTLRQNVINGLSPMEFLWAKLSLVLSLSLACALVVGISVMALGLLDDGITTAGWMFGKAGFLLGYFLQTLGYLVFTLWLTLLVKRSGITIGILFIYVWFIENIVRAIWSDKVAAWLPVRSFNLLVEMPFSALFKGEILPFASTTEYAVAVGYILLFFSMSAWLLKTRDL